MPPSKCTNRVRVEIGILLSHCATTATMAKTLVPPKRQNYWVRRRNLIRIIPNPIAQSIFSWKSYGLWSNLLCAWYEKYVFTSDLLFYSCIIFLFNFYRCVSIRIKDDFLQEIHVDVYIMFFYTTESFLNECLPLFENFKRELFFEATEYGFWYLIRE